MSGTWTYGRRLSSKTSIGTSARVRSFDIRASKSIIDITELSNNAKCIGWKKELDRTVAAGSADFDCDCATITDLKLRLFLLRRRRCVHGFSVCRFVAEKKSMNKFDQG